jgi:hypothetical protein
MPANAPASMFAVREKFGGSASYLVRWSAIRRPRCRPCVGAVLVFFFDWNDRVIMGGHEAARQWRCRFQVGD